ncbi:MAG: ceramidase domain-containing protein [Hyphomicrobiaceae bacterium]|nr:ceramidase domain-containing protein [Hyphomicrobiaceae bacterium]
MDVLERWARGIESLVPPGPWHDRIFAYCERGWNPAFWAEPLNAVSNAAFLIAAVAALVVWLRQPGTARGVVELALILLVAAIGIGSFLFHTLATRWSAVADTAPIAIFMLAYVVYALRRLVGLPWIAVGAGLGVFLAALWQASGVRCQGGGLCLGGSVAYLPALGALALVTLALAIRRSAAALTVGAAGLAFAASLTFRTLDRQLCPQTFVPNLGTIGTHFLWHCLNAVVLYLLLRAALSHRRQSAQA